MNLQCAFFGLVALAAVAIPVFLVWVAILFREIHRALAVVHDDAPKGKYYDL
jgi:hypothetical protein